jgi:hypothetical protein
MSLGLATLALGVSSGAGCSSDFENCESSRNCPGDSAGTGGTASGGSNTGSGAANGSAGDPSSAAGTANAQGGDSFVIGSGGDSGLPPLPTDCEADADCDDGHVCTGSEKCVDGACQYGELPCPNADPDHCAITCLDDISGAICGLQGLDADGDGYLTAACSDNPGDDCNDSPTDGVDLHPGVAELCNGGIDDDCDGADETTDEVLLSGASEVLAMPVGTSRRDQVAITANKTGSGFGVTWADWQHAASPTTAEIYYLALAADGTASEPVRATNSLAYNENDYPDIEWGPTTYVTVSYRSTEVSSGDQLVRSVKVAQDASSTTTPTTLGTAAVTAGPKAGGGTFVQIDNEIYKCTTSCASVIAVGDSIQSFAVGGGQVAYAHGAANNWLIATYNDATSQTTQVGSSTTEPRVAISPGGNTVVFREQAAVSGASNLRLANCTLPDGLPLAVAGIGLTWVVLYSNLDETALYVRIVKPGCAAGPSALVVEEDGTAIGNADLIADKNGRIAVVWSSKDSSSNQWSIMGRVFGINLCE